MPFALCFIVPNLLRFAPWVWDNIKILIYWYIVSAPLVCLVLASMWRGGRVMRAASLGLFLLLTAAGALEVWRVISGASSYRGFGTAEIEFAQMIRESTPPGSTVLHAPVHNNPVFLSGRRSLLGAPGHVWSHGIGSDQRQSDIKQMYGGSVGAHRLIEQYGIEYAVIGPAEEEEMKINSSAFPANFDLIGEVGQYRLYAYRGERSKRPLPDTNELICPD